MTTTQRFKVTGINDQRDFCECCGKSGLQRVVWVLDTETGDENHFGTSCATTPAKGFDCIPEIKAAVRSATAAVKASWSTAHKLYRAAGGEYVNGRDESGSPVRTVADADLWNSIQRAEESKALARLAA